MGLDEALATGAFIIPSPGEVGAFSCSQCGSAQLRLVPSPDGRAVVRLMCAVCFNYLDFTDVTEETRASTREH